MTLLISRWAMKFTKTKPCNNCPFRTDIQPYLSQGRAEEIIHEITENQQTFTCHKTSKKLSPEYKGEEQHCAGALILLEHNNQPNQMMRIAERIGFYDRRKLDMTSPVFDNYEDFIDAQN